MVSMNMVSTSMVQLGYGSTVLNLLGKHEKLVHEMSARNLVSKNRKVHILGHRDIFLFPCSCFLVVLWSS